MKTPDTNNPEPKLLLHLHKKIGVYLQPGGHVELNENPWSAMLHELEEETGYVSEQLQVLQPTPTPPFATIDHSIIHPTPMVVSSHGFKKWSTHYHTDLTYAFVTSELPQQTVKPGESETFIWVTLEELQKIPNDEIVEGARQVGVQALTYFYENWHPVNMSLFSGENPPSF